jgi:uncharacterized protein (TIGR00369 family)
MADLTIKLGVSALNDVLAEAFPSDTRVDIVRDVEPGKVLLVRPFHSSMLRPGGLISGPTLMALADHAAYALILAHVGAELMAVTTSLTMHFLRGAKPADIHAEARFLSLGRRLAVCDIRLWTETPARMAAQATATYARAPS